VDGIVTAFTWDWAAGVPEILSAGDALYLVGHETLGQYADGAWTYYLPDALGSVRQATDGAGAVVSAREWSPYGEELGGAQAGLGYTGEWFDDGAGLLYLRARWYEPGVGRFTRRDPWVGNHRRSLTMHQYVYALQNPSNLVDPSGFISVSPGFIERSVTPYVPPFVLSAQGAGGGTGLWLEAATEIPVVKEVYDEFRTRLINGNYLNRSITDLYRDVWFDSFLELSKAGFCGGNLLLECAHMSLVVLGRVAVVDRWDNAFQSGFGNLPGYIPNEEATNPRDRQGADTTTHFFAHAFLSFEMLYSDEMRNLGYEFPAQGLGGMTGSTTGEQIRDALGVPAQLVGDKTAIINRWYAGYAQEYGFEEYYHLSQDNRAQIAYNTAVFAGNLYEMGVNTLSYLHLTCHI